MPAGSISRFPSTPCPTPATLAAAAVRRRLERVLGATLIALGIDLAAATR